jgi:threonine/homoserine/homoserine lactone efflux protein
MDVTTALAAFSVAALILTITPGLDTTLVLRAALTGQRRAALQAGLGIIAGMAVWGIAAALGIGLLLSLSMVAGAIIRLVGAAYLFALGVQFIRRPRQRIEITDPRGPGSAWLRRGFLSNLLNPKIGVFYATLLPQFLPVGVAPTPFLLLLTAIHMIETILWFVLLTIAAARFAAALRRPAVIRAMDRVTGAVLFGFGAKLLYDFAQSLRGARAA